LLEDAVDLASREASRFVTQLLDDVCCRNPHTLELDTRFLAHPLHSFDDFRVSTLAIGGRAAVQVVMGRCVWNAVGCAEDPKWNARFALKNA
jgi:hypothetical protein